MRWELNDIASYRVHARDGSLGTVSDVYFDDMFWMIRYLAVTGESSPTGQRQYLLAPEVISGTDREYGLVSVVLRQHAVLGSPAVVVDKTIPRTEENKLREYYGLPDYWPPLAAGEETPQMYAAHNPRLHSLDEVLGYRVLAGQDEIGALIDIAIDDRSWAIQGLELDASAWLPTGRIWIKPDGVRQVRAQKKEITLSVTREAVASHPKLALTAMQETQGGVLPTHPLPRRCLQ